MDFNVTTPNGRDVFQPSLHISTIPSRCVSETANWNVDSETGRFVSMGSDAEISGLNNGSGDPLGAASKCLELKETENLEASGMGNFDFIDGGSESILCLGMSSVDAETSSGRGDPSCAGLSGYMGSKSREMNLEDSTLARSRKSSTNVTSEASLEYQQDDSRHLGALGPRRGCCPARCQGYVRRFAGYHN